MPKRKKTTNIPVLVTISGGVLLIIAALMLASRPVPQEQPPSGPISSSHEEETFPEIPRVDPAESKAALDSGTAVFLDVRSEGSFATGHIPGALNIPLAELESRLDELDPNQWIITYCA